MPPFVAKALNAAGAELELPAKVQELLAGQTPRSILPHETLRILSQFPLVRGSTASQARRSMLRSLHAVCV